MAVKWNKDLANRVRQAAFRGTVNGVEGVKANAIERIQSGPKTGRVYRRRGVEHQASAPGEAPASDTGRLVQSANTEHSVNPIQSDLNFGTEYAASLEFGTERMEPRPYARVSLQEEKENIVNGIADEIRRELK